MEWRGDQVKIFSRAFLDTNGVTQNVDVDISSPGVGELQGIRS